MATSFNTQIGGGEYRLQFETDNKEQYLFMQDAARMCVDGHLPTIEPPRWIPVSKRLPEKDGQYLIFTTEYFTPDHVDEPDHRNEIKISYYSKEFGFMGNHGLFAKAWTYCPDPPKEDQHD